MNIRSFVASDLAEAVRLFTDAVHVGAAYHYDAAQRSAWAPRPADLNHWQARFERLHTLVAERDGQLIGFISFESDGHIDLLFTSPASARQGVASALYQRVEAILYAQQVHELHTEASLVARPFFERQGFEVIAEEIVSRQGVDLIRFRMRKKLKNPPKNPID